jgi:membrane-bound lytic murein transglycosylase D
MRALTHLTVLAISGFVVGCSARVAPAVPVADLPVSTPQQTQVPDVMPSVALVDPIDALIAISEGHFAAGQKELQLGHLTAASTLFDRAVDVLLAAPTGARGEPRLKAHYDRLLGRISALEILALREGDGFTQARTEPAVIDDLLAVATLDLPNASTATTEAVVEDLANTEHDLPIELNDRILSFIELFQGNLRTFMQDSLHRSAKYMPMVQSVFRAEGLPLDLAYLAIVESGFKNTALSRASARGMWQFMPATGKEHGLTQNWFIDERADPEKATRAAAQYLKTLNKMFDGDWNLAMASYNAGPGRLQRAVKSSKLNDYWKLTETSRFLPKETRNYVPMIMAAVIIAKNPTQYGFEPGVNTALAYDTVTVPDALDLRTVAEWTETSIEEIRDLNPELRRTITPVGKHDLKVPVGMAPIVEAKLAEAGPATFAKFERYAAKRGETMLTVARKFKVTTADLASANGLTTRSRLKVGQSLMIPRAVSAALASRPAEAPEPAAATTLTYRVKSGDTLFGIARQFDTTVDDIKRWNSLTSSRIDIGDRLTIHRNN